MNRQLDSLVPTKENNVKVFAVEPDFHNPNSFENISVILRDLGVFAGITKY